MQNRIQGILVAALGGMVAAGCAAPTSGGPESSSPPSQRAVVEVTNNNWLDINVYAVRSGQRARLGTVNSMTTVTFTIPAALVGSGEVRLMAAPIGSPSVHHTDPILLSVGDRIHWHLENSLPLSNYSVRHASQR